MATAVYTPELSFHGSLHWHMPDGNPAVHGLSASYIEQAPTALDNGWVFCSAKDTYSGLKRIALGLDEVSGRLVGLQFWFACYFCGEAAGLSRYRYDVRVFQQPQHANPFQFYKLEVSRNGYLGLYQSDSPHGFRVLQDSDLWELEGLDPWELQGGASVPALGLISPPRRPVRRLVEEGFPYLSDRDGHDARFTLTVEPNGLERPW